MSKEEKQIVCWASPGCKMYCGLIAEVEDGKLTALRPNAAYPSIYIPSARDF